MTEYVLDCFAGPGGWDEGLRLAGYQGELVGVELDPSACRTATAAGHARVQADVTELDPERFVSSLGWPRVDGLIQSPPCGGFSTAGKGGGELDRPRCHALVDAYAAGRTLPGVEWADARSPLVAEPVRWARTLRPRWIALEQVPPVLPLWQHIAHVLRGWGYSAWCGLLGAEEYGVPQTRTRVILMASLGGPVSRPVPTHQAWRSGRPLVTEDNLFGAPLPPPVSMAEALGWDGVDRPARTICGARNPRWAYGEANSYATGWSLRSNYGTGGDAQNRGEREPSEPASTVTGKVKGASWVLRNGNQANACERTLDQPAGTMFFGNRANAVEWLVDTGQDSTMGGGRTQRYTRSVDEPSPTTVQTNRWRIRPATTVQGDPRVWPPGHKVNADDRARLGDEADERYGDRAGTDAVRVSIVEAAILQGFPPDYPWAGTKTAQYRQVGDAVPPPLARAVLGPLLTPVTTVNTTGEVP